MVIWRDVAGYEGLYEASDDGRVFSRYKRGTILKSFVVSPYGHVSVSLSRGGKQQTYAVGAVVLMAFVGPRPEGAEVSYRDGDPTNNALSNLSWGTTSGNKQASVVRGTAACCRFGEDSNGAKLSNADVEAIRMLAEAGAIQAELAREYRVSEAHISFLVNWLRRENDNLTKD